MGNAPIVVIVDDDERVRSSLEGLMDAAGFEPYTFASAEEFFNCELSSETVCIISDIRMPGMSGLELQQTLKARGCRIPIIFITAYGNAQIRSEAMGEGAIAFLTKPFDDEALLDNVRAVLKTRRSLS